MELESLIKKLKSIQSNPIYYISSHFETLKFKVDKAFLNYSGDIQKNQYRFCIDRIQTLEKDTINNLDNEILNMFKSKIERLEQECSNKKQDNLAPEIIKKIKQLEYNMNAVLFGNKTTFFLKEYKTSLVNLIVKFDDFYFENMTEIDNLEPSSGFFNRTELCKSLIKRRIEYDKYNTTPDPYFRGIKIRNYFNIENNYLDLFYGFENYFEIIDVDSCEIQQLPPILNGLINLKTLSLAGNNLAKLEACIFNGLTNLETLVIANNKLTELHDEIFKGLKNLKIIDFNSNKITKLNAKVFKNLECLWFVDFSYNQINHLDKRLFNNLKNLEVLNFAHNLIEVLPENIFDDLTMLNRMIFNSNKIKSLNSNIFKNLKNLSDINFEHNQIIDSDLNKCYGYFRKIP
jgi:Leucine-rich repeat (LRR) protein